MNILKKSLFVFLVFSLLLTGCRSQGDTVGTEETAATPLPVIAEGRIVPADFLNLTFAVRGHVEAILVEEGQQVRAGQVLVRLADQEQAEAALAAAHLAHEQAQQDHAAFVRTEDLARANTWKAYMEAQAARAIAERQWEALDLDGINERIEAAEADLRDRQQDLEDAQARFDRYADLDPANATREQAENDLEQTQEDYNEALRQLEGVTRQRDSLRVSLDLALAVEAEARRAFEATRAGLDLDQRSLLEARLTHAEAQLAATESALANYELTAPFAGTITDINVVEYEYIGPEKWAILIADFSTMSVETTDLTELEVVKLYEGQTVTVVADALPEYEMTGTVESIGQSFRFQGGDVLYSVRIRLSDLDARMRWGMTVEVEFEPIE
ncbi:MAG: efflux RND transporter periplasmic adaptor subunit [Chloroflexota bacterium]